MTLLDNSILHLLSQLIFLFGLGCLVLSYLKKRYEYANWGFIAVFIGLLQILLIALLKGDAFVLSKEVDYGANFAFTFSAICLSIITAVGLTFYYLHRLIPAIFMQVGMLFTGILILVTLSTSISRSLGKKETAAKVESVKFMKAEDFQKGNPNSGFSKAESKSDSISVR
jgi:hypothetical protein